MITALIPVIGSIIGNVVDKFIPDKDLAEKVKAEVILESMRQDNDLMKSTTSVILAEANGESWLQRNWRPSVMIFLTGLVGAHWLGFTPENLTQETINHLLDIVQVGLAGYVIGRSGEKIMKSYKEK